MPSFFYFYKGVELLKDVKEKPKSQTNVKEKPKMGTKRILQRTATAPAAAGTRMAKRYVANQLKETSQGQNSKGESQAVNAATNDLKRHTSNAARHTADYAGRATKRGVKLAKDRIKQRVEAKDGLRNPTNSNVPDSFRTVEPQTHAPTRQEVGARFNSRGNYFDGTVAPKTKDRMLQNSRRVKERSAMQNVKQKDGAINRATDNKTKNIKDAAQKKVSAKQSTGANRTQQKIDKAAGGRARKTAQRLLNKAQQRAKSRAVKKAQKAMAKKSAATAKKGAIATKKTAITAKKVAIKTTKIITKIAVAIIKGIVALIAAGGWVVIVIILIIALLMMIFSPSGILFSNDNNTPYSTPISAVVGMLNAEFSNDLRELQSTPHDVLEMHGNMADWVEVIAVFAVKTAGRQDEYAQDVVIFDDENIERLRVVFRDMNGLRSRIESRSSGEGDTITVLHIYIDSRGYAVMAEYYNFTPDQKNMLAELLSHRVLLAGLIGHLHTFSADTAAILAQLPADLSPERRAVVTYSLSLVGRVNYFWGGKSNQIGWDSRWGTLQRVTAAGSSTTGQMRVFGMDCSGLVTWVFINASRNLGATSIIGEGTWAQDANSTRIAWNSAQPGDLAFFNDLSHVGIVVGHDEDGHLLVAHVSSSFNNVTVCRAADFGFGFVSRPNFSMFQQENMIIR